MKTRLPTRLVYQLGLAGWIIYAVLPFISTAILHYSEPPLTSSRVGVTSWFPTTLADAGLPLWEVGVILLTVFLILVAVTGAGVLMARWNRLSRGATMMLLSSIVELWPSSQSTSKGLP